MTSEALHEKKKKRGKNKETSKLFIIDCRNKKKPFQQLIL